MSCKLLISFVVCHQYQISVFFSLLPAWWYDNWVVSLRGYSNSMSAKFLIMEDFIRADHC